MYGNLTKTHDSMFLENLIFFSFSEDGICSPEDIETAVTEGLGLRYALIGPFETMHLNANGMLLFRSYNTFIFPYVHAD